MNAYLITSQNETSEWISNFIKVQEYMNQLESKGILTAKVQKFENSKLTKEIQYSFDGQIWTK